MPERLPVRHSPRRYRALLAMSPEPKRLDKPNRSPPALYAAGPVMGGGARHIVDRTRRLSLGEHHNLRVPLFHFYCYVAVR